jgi:thiol:disulfide interchange protein DsbD
VMLDFYADWCISCKEMERFTFTDPEVKNRLGDVVLLQVDVTEGTTDDEALLKYFKLFGPPGILFFDPYGREIYDARTIGYQNKEEFLAILNAVLI